MAIVAEPSCIQFTPSKLAYPTKLLPVRFRRSQLEGKFMGAFPEIAAAAPSDARLSKNAPADAGVISAAAKMLFAFVFWRAIKPALVQTSDTLRFWTRTRTSKSPLRC